MAPQRCAPSCSRRCALGRERCELPRCLSYSSGSTARQAGCGAFTGLLAWEPHAGAVGGALLLRAACRKPSH